MSILLCKLKACRDVQALKKISATEIVSSIYVANTFIDMYAKCGAMELAHKAFDKMPAHDVVSWNAILQGYAGNGEYGMALQLFGQINCAPDSRTFVIVLKACSKLANQKQLCKINCFEKGLSIHLQAAKCGCNGDIFVASTLIDMYAKCESMVNARKVFDGMEGHDVVAWTALIMGYVDKGECELALELYTNMRKGGCVPNSKTLLAALKACTNLATKERGKEINGNLLKVESLKRGNSILSESGCNLDPFFVCTLVDFYAKCGKIENAHKEFDRMPHHNVASWNALMMGYEDNGKSERTLDLFERMEASGVKPDARSFVAALKACTSLSRKEEGEEVDGKILKRVCLEKGLAIHSKLAISRYCHLDIFVASVLIDMYAKCGSIWNARMVFERMPLHDVVSITALIIGYADNGEPAVSLQLFAEMRCSPNARTFVAALKACASMAASKGNTELSIKFVCLERGIAIHHQAFKAGLAFNKHVSSTLVHMYAKCGSMVHAREVFDQMQLRDVVSWNAMMLGYAENGTGDVTLQLYARMPCAPDAFSFVAALLACGSLAALETGKSLHADICKCGLESNTLVRTCLIDFYCNCGRMIVSHELFDKSAANNVVTYRVLLAGYSRQGDTQNVFALFQKLREEGLQVNGFIFNLILATCSHAGLIEKAKEYFNMMWSDYGIKPGIDHYHCMIDCYSRANNVELAVTLINDMPFQPDAIAWRIVLGACERLQNLYAGKIAFNSLLKIDHNHPAAYVLMANIYDTTFHN